MVAFSTFEFYPILNLFGGCTETKKGEGGFLLPLLNTMETSDDEEEVLKNLSEKFYNLESPTKRRKDEEIGR